MSEPQPPKPEKNYWCWLHPDRLCDSECMAFLPEQEERQRCSVLQDVHALVQQGERNYQLTKRIEIDRLRGASMPKVP